MFWFQKPSRERRHSTRQKVWLGHETGFAIRACVMIDRSGSGAKLWIKDAGFIGSRMRLKLSPASRGRKCRVAWQKGHLLGIEYIGRI